jgi:hypothetical protein
LFPESIHSVKNKTCHARSQATWCAPASGRCTDQPRARTLLTSSLYLMMNSDLPASDLHRLLATNMWPDAQAHGNPASDHNSSSSVSLRATANTDRTLTLACGHCVTSVRSVFLSKKHFSDFATSLTLVQMC